VKHIALSALLGLLLLGCLPDARVAHPRYFSLVPPSESIDPPAAATDAGPLLRLRRVQAASYLRERIVWRRSETEVGFYELARWTQPPAQWVEQWLARELFGARGLRRALAGPYPLLQVNTLAFDEVLEPERAARVELTAWLTDRSGISLLERTYAAEKPVERDQPEALARAMGAALADVVQRLGADVEDALASLGP
jgi:ABC-type uncharacterized transport system auxiliary subunit